MQISVLKVNVNKVFPDQDDVKYKLSDCQH